MRSSAHSLTTPASFTASAIAHRDEREACERKLIAALRTVAHLASQLANDAPSFSERARLNQITARADDELRRLCNQRRLA